MTPMGVSQVSWLLMFLGGGLYFTATAYLLSHVFDTWDGLTFLVLVVESLVISMVQKLWTYGKAFEERLAPE
jgi:hypothetical protein